MPHGIDLKYPVEPVRTLTEDGKDPRRQRPDGKQRPWECPPPDDCDTPGMEPNSQRMLEREVAVKIDHGQKNQGDVPGTLKRFADQILRPKVDPFSRAS